MAPEATAVEHHDGPHRGRLGAVGRGWRRFRRRPAAMQIRTVALVVVVLGGTLAWVALAPSTQAQAQSSSGSGSSAIDRASTSSRGVTATTINVAFPVVALNSLAGKEGFAQDVEFSDQINAIHLYVNDINHSGGINGRKLVAHIYQFDPTDDAAMAALCQQWTEGSPPIFAVVDGQGTWTGTNQLCVAQQGKTPMIGAWSTVSKWTEEAAPYLWWTEADQSVELQALVNWGLASGRLEGKKVGVIVGDDSADQVAWNDYLQPDLARLGITPPTVETIAANLSETAQTNTDAPLVVQHLRAAGVQTVFPILPFNAFLPVLGAETQQGYFPTLMLSDYQSSITSALGLIPQPYLQALNGQEGVTTLTLGGIDDPRPESQGGYDPGVRACYEAWIKKYPKPQIGPNTDRNDLTNYIEEQGPIASWCGAIHLFAVAAQAAGHDLNRRTFVKAMAGIKNFPGTLSPVLSFGPNKYYGPTQYQVVKIHNNVPPSSQCILKNNHQPQGTCWVVVQKWQPLPTG